MPPRFRLSRTDFKQMRGFRRAHGVLFSLSFGTLPNRDVPAAACVVSAKVAPRAVDRNRIKRRARDVMLPFLRDLRTPGVFILFATKGATKASFGETRDDITSLTDRALRALA